MKNLWVKASILAAVCMVVGCAESKDDTVVTSCTASYCKDASTLMACTNGQASEITCPNGCSGDACITANTCTANRCQDSQTLLFCSGGVAQAIPCPFGCANDQCNASADQQQQQQQQSSCTVSLCQDSTTLLACVGGVQQAVVCPWGCENNMCKSQINQDPNKTNTCVADTCRDASTLLACVNGYQQVVSCPLGCSNNACNVASGCENGTKQCSGTKVQFCAGSTWVDLENCSVSCQNGECIDTPPENQCANGSKRCNGNSVQYCAYGMWIDVTSCPNGCANGLCSNEPVKECNNSDRICDGNQSFVCLNNSWVKNENCEFGCQNGSCLECSENQTRCMSGAMQTCVNNSWKTTSTCSQGCNSVGTGCKEDTAQCSNGQKQCNGAIVQSCSNGTWVNGNACDYGCENGVCKSPVCTTGDKQCSGNNLQTCTNNAWVTSETCQNGCENKACKSSSTTTPVVGSSCDPDTYPETCANNTAYYCDEDAVADYACSSSTSCKVNTSGIADCVESCSVSQKGQTGSYLCYDYYGMMMIAYPIVCSAAQDGSYGYFVDTNNYEMCESYCSADKGCTDTVEYSECVSANNKSYCKSSGMDLCIAENGIDSYCADSCSKEGTTSTVCEEYEGKYYTFYYECTKAGNILFNQMSDEKYDECPNGCNAAGTACAGSSTNPSECSDGALQCSGYGVPQKCVNGKWQTQTACTAGTYCENGVCKSGSSTQPTTPKVGAPCDSSFQYVCTDSVLYYCGSEKKVVSYKCDASHGMACDILKDGSQDCVYTNETVKNLCTKDGEQVPAYNDPCDDGVYYYLGCKLNKAGQIVGVESAALTICYDYNGTSYMLGCNSNDEEGSAVCSSSCTYDASTYQAVCK